MSQQVKELLEKLIDEHEKLLKIAHEKTEVLKRNEIEKLQTILRQEQTLVAQIHMLENKRQQLLGKEVTISEWIDTLEGPAKETFLELQQRLLNVLNELQETNALNQQLLQLSLQFVEMNLELLTPTTDLPHYTHKGKEATPYKDVGGRSAFDSKA